MANYQDSIRAHYSLPISIIFGHVLCDNQEISKCLECDELRKEIKSQQILINNLLSMQNDKEIEMKSLKQRLSQTDEENEILKSWAEWTENGKQLKQENESTELRLKEMEKRDIPWKKQLMRCRWIYSKHKMREIIISRNIMNQLKNVNKYRWN